MFGRATVRLGIGPHSSIYTCFDLLHSRLIDKDVHFLLCYVHFVLNRWPLLSDSDETTEYAVLKSSCMTPDA